VNHSYHGGEPQGSRDGVVPIVARLCHRDGPHDTAGETLRRGPWNPWWQVRPGAGVTVSPLPPPPVPAPGSSRLQVWTASGTSGLSARPPPAAELAPHLVAGSRRRRRLLPGSSMTGARGVTPGMCVQSAASNGLTPSVHYLYEQLAQVPIPAGGLSDHSSKCPPGRYPNHRALPTPSLDQ
jgi:hypothetical protein